MIKFLRMLADVNTDQLVTEISEEITKVNHKKLEALTIKYEIPLVNI